MFHLFNRIRHYKQRNRKLVIALKSWKEQYQWLETKYCERPARSTCDQYHQIVKTNLKRKNAELQTACDDLQAQLTHSKTEQAEREKHERAVYNLTIALDNANRQLAKAQEKLTEWEDADVSALKTKWLDAHCHTLNHQNYGDGQFYELWEQRHQAEIRAFLHAHQQDLTEADITYVKKATDYLSDEQMGNERWYYDVEENDVKLVSSAVA